MRRSGVDAPDFQLEVVVEDADGPSLCGIRYTLPNGHERTLLVAVTPSEFGPPASFVRLPGFTTETTSNWAAYGPGAVPINPGWDEETVVESVRASLNEATRNAWREVSTLVGDPLRTIIEDELR